MPRGTRFFRVAWRAMPRSRLGALAGAIALAAAVAGCGGGEEDSADEFREGYNDAIGRLGRISEGFDEVGGSRAQERNRSIATELDRFADSAGRTRDELSRLEPPEDASDEFETLLTELEQVTQDLRRAASAARESDPSSYNEAVGDIADGSEELTVAETALQRAVGG